MDFRLLALSLLLWSFSCVLWAAERLDTLANTLYQYPTLALTQINELERQASELSQAQVLRLQLFKCEALLQLGDNGAAINLAELGEARAKQLRLEQADSYFQICRADAYANFDDLKQSLLLLDGAIEQAKRHNQPQALVNALRLKGQLENDLGNYGTAIEDLRLALDIYPDISSQNPSWLWPPLAYVYGDMASLMYSTGDLRQAAYYLKLALDTDEAKGKVRHVLLLMAARVALAQEDMAQADSLLKQSKILLPEIGSPLELANSYSQIAVIELARGRTEIADELVGIALQTYEKQGKVNNYMRATRLLARVRLAQRNDDEGIRLLMQAAQQAEQLQLADEVAYTQQLISDYYAERAEFKPAYEAMKLAAQAAAEAQKQLNNTRFMQYKARLSQQEQLQVETQQNIRLASADQRSKLSQAYGTIFVLALAIIGALIWLVSRRNRWQQPSTEALEKLPAAQQLDAMLSSAKKGNYPLSLLLLSTSHIRQVDLSALQRALEQKLREQDRLLRYSMDEMVILLPYTSVQGALQVSEQLKPIVQSWQVAHAVRIGVASLQQPDTLDSLVKRAGVNQLSQQKAAEQHQSPAR
ncbi:diguanylate cyclase domain-containing protein [Shewanella algae]|uniref:diguanylate cyclase domain-containing protein n=1 Tax=Shewanella algae TaxID=38313 RepID=UPI0031F5B072